MPLDNEWKIMTLYNTYRPQRFDELIGQAPVRHAFTQILAQGNVAGAYLFSGPRGCGKTTTARLFAKALNCEAPDGIEPCNNCSSCVSINKGISMDVVEYDAATNSGVDAARDIIAEVSLASPGKRKVYIFDEVHMFSTAASNALLKTLEEPPAGVTFILATTDPSKLLPTVRSRCISYEFSLVSPTELEKNVREVLRKEGRDILTDEEILSVVYAARGSVRDSLSLLEKALSTQGSEAGVSHEWELVKALVSKEFKSVVLAIAAAHQAGVSSRVLAEQTVDALREFFLIQMGAPELLTTPEQKDRTTLAQKMGPKNTVAAIEFIADAIKDMQSNYDQRISLEVALARFCRTN